MIYTSCTNCAFFQDRCLLEKPIKDGMIAGYCNFKRDNKWYKKNNIHNIGEATDLIEHEESQISVLISCLDLDIDKLNDTLESLYDNSYLKKIVLITNTNSDKAISDSLTDFVKDNSTVEWSLIKIFETELTNVDAFHKGYYEITTNWFMCLKQGELMPDISDIMKSTIDPSANCLLYYSDIFNNETKSLMNKFAFKEWQGNVGATFFEKVKAMPEWTDVCTTINQ